MNKMPANKKDSKALFFIIALLWSIILLILQLILYNYYVNKQPQILGIKEVTQICIPIIGLFAIGEIIAGLILTKENFIKYNAIYTFIITIVLTIGTAFIATIMTEIFHITYFLSYLIKENGMNHVPPYTFFSMIFISLCTLLSLIIPQRYFGQIKFNRKRLAILIFYFIIISIHL